MPREFSVRRYVLIVRNEGVALEDRPRLLAQLRGRVGRVSNVRVASDHLEVDVVTDNVDKVREVVGDLVGEVLEVVDLEELRGRSVELDEAVRQYVELFNRERFREAHEVIDGSIDRAKSERERVILRALALVAGAYAQAQCGRHDLAKRNLADVLDLLEELGGNFYGINIDSLKKSIESSLRAARVRSFNIRLER